MLLIFCFRDAACIPAQSTIIRWQYISIVFDLCLNEGTNQAPKNTLISWDTKMQRTDLSQFKEFIHCFKGSSLPWVIQQNSIKLTTEEKHTKIRKILITLQVCWCRLIFQVQRKIWSFYPDLPTLINPKNCRLFISLLWVLKHIIAI